MKQWVLEAHHAEKLAASNDYDEIKSFIGKIGTNRHLTDKKAGWIWASVWKILAQKSQSSSWLGMRDSNPTGILPS